MVLEPQQSDPLALPFFLSRHVGSSYDEDPILMEEAAKVDERLVEMCKKELITAPEVKLLPKRCRGTLLKYLAQSKPEGGDTKAEPL